MTSRDEALRALEKAVELVAKATPDWRESRNGNIVGGEFQQYAKGSAQSQVAMFCCVTSADDPVEAQLSNAAAALAAVNFIREHGSSILSDRQEVATVADEEAIGMASDLPGSNGGFTHCVFNASEVPRGSLLFTSPAQTSEARDAQSKLDEVCAYVINLAEEADDLYERGLADRDEDFVDYQVIRLTAINQIGRKLGCIVDDAAMRQEAGDGE